MLARLSLAALSLALVAAAPAVAKEKTKPATPEAVACSGVYGPDSSEALVKQTFGADNVVTGTVPGPEGEDMLATTVFPNDPDRTMQFGWWDDETRTGLSYVELAPTQIAPNGAHVGQTVAEVEKLNGKPFTVGGFWWDYGGYANFEGGKLENADDTTCWISLRFAPNDEYPADLDVSAVSGEVQVPSTEKLLSTLDVRVQSVDISWPGPEGDE